MEAKNNNNKKQSHEPKKKKNQDWGIASVICSAGEFEAILYRIRRELLSSEYWRGSVIRTFTNIIYKKTGCKTFLLRYSTKTSSSFLSSKAGTPHAVRRVEVLRLAASKEQALALTIARGSLSPMVLVFGKLGRGSGRSALGSGTSEPGFGRWELDSGKRCLSVARPEAGSERRRERRAWCRVRWLTR